MNLTDRQKGRMMYISLMWEGPWERLTLWLIKLDWRTNEIRGEVRYGSVRDRLGDFCERRDIAWRRRYAVTNTFPPKRWRRRIRPCQPASAPPADVDSPE